MNGAQLLDDVTGRGKKKWKEFCTFPVAESQKAPSLLSLSLSLSLSLIPHRGSPHTEIAPPSLF
jgi:hypothetical protein